MVVESEVSSTVEEQGQWEDGEFTWRNVLVGAFYPKLVSVHKRDEVGSFIMEQNLTMGAT